MDSNPHLGDFWMFFSVHVKVNWVLMLLPLLWFLWSGCLHLPWQHDWHALGEAGPEHHHTVRRDAGQITRPERRSTPNKPWNQSSEESRSIVASGTLFRARVCGLALRLCRVSEDAFYCGLRSVARLTHTPSLWFQYSFASFQWYKIWKSGACFCFNSGAPPPPTLRSWQLGERVNKHNKPLLWSFSLGPSLPHSPQPPTQGLTRKHQSPAHIKNTQMEVCNVVTFQKKKVSLAVETCNPLADKAVWWRGWEGSDTPWPARVHTLLLSYSNIKNWTFTFSAWLGLFVIVFFCFFYEGRSY